MKPLISIVIINYNTYRLTLDCLYSIKVDKTIPNYEIILVDNGSVDDSLSAFKKLKWINLKLIINKENLGFAKAANQGIKRAKGKFVFLLNSDTQVLKGTLKKIIDFALNSKDAGVIAPKLVSKNGKTEASVFVLPTLSGAIKEFWLGKKGSYGQYIPSGEKPKVVEAVVGAAFLLTPLALKKVGLFDERFFMYFEDLDYCRRVKKAGLKVYYLPSATVVHLHGQSGRNLVESQKQWTRLIPSSKIYFGWLKYYLIFFVLFLSQCCKKIKTGLIGR